MAFSYETESPGKMQISILRASYGARTTAARASPTGPNSTITGVSVVKPPKRALFACPRHSSLELRQPEVKSSEQAQADNKINFIFNGWLRFNIADFWRQPARPPPALTEFIVLVLVVSM